MLFSEHFNTLSAPAEFVLREKGSKFFSFTFPISSEDAFKIELQKIKQKYPDATHHCYALILNPDKSFQKSSDDGEPSNTAGKPILRAILSLDLTNVAVVVVRYFGGTMLGVPGLISAYHQSALEALKLAPVKEVSIEDTYVLRCELKHENEAHRFVKKLNAKIISTEYLEDFVLVFRLKRSKSALLKSFGDTYYYLKIEPC